MTFPHRSRDRRPRSLHLLMLAALVLAALTSARTRPVYAHAGAHISTTPRRVPGMGYGLINGLLALQVRHAQQARRPGRHSFRDHLTSPLVPLEIKTDRDVSAAVRSLGGLVEADIRGRIIAARVPANEIATLAQQPGVRTLYPSLALHESLDQSVSDIRANQVWTQPAPGGGTIQGNHVLVAVVDSGIDYHNPDFKNPDGSMRIKYIWDQTTNGHAPAGYTFGYECDAASINSGQCPEKDTDGHGTHVSGIAAGNGRSSTPAREIGVAPQADIIVIKRGQGTDQTIAAWKYIIAKAQQLHEPVVINNSFGGMISPHNGSSPLSEAADLLAGPGKIFVAAAGNEGNAALHTDGTLGANQTTTLQMDVSGHDNDITFGLFYPAQDSFTFRLRNDLTGEIYGPFKPGQAVDNHTVAGGKLKITLANDTWDGNFRVIYGHLASSDGTPIDAGRLSLDLAGSKVRDTGRFDAWIDQDDAAHFTMADEADTINEPADSRHVIAVGNYATRVSWTDRDNHVHQVCNNFPCTNNSLQVGEIAAYSSIGPTADGRQKPDISAPGTMILSSLSHDASVCGSDTQDNCLSPRHISPDGANLWETGTSMSAPHVAGVVALMLQVSPNLDQDQVTALLKSTARHDSFTSAAAWTPVYGAGKVDALAAVQAAARLQPRNTVARFSVTRIRIQASDKDNAPALKTSAVGKKAYVVIYWKVSAVPSGMKPLYVYNATLGGKVVAHDSLRGSQPSYSPGDYYATFPLKFSYPGSWVFTGNISIGGVNHQSRTSILVKR